MLLSALILVQAAAVATPASPPASPEREAMQTGEAYGQCIGGAAQSHARAIDDLDAILARAIEDCSAEGRLARQSYIAYLRASGIEMTEEQVDRMFTDGLPQLRQRIAGCLAADRANREDGGQRMC